MEGKKLFESQLQIELTTLTLKFINPTSNYP